MSCLLGMVIFHSYVSLPDGMYIHIYNIYIYMCMKNIWTIAAVFSSRVADDQRICGFVWVVHHTYQGTGHMRDYGDQEKRQTNSLCVWKPGIPHFFNQYFVFFLWCLHHCATNTIMRSRFVASGERRGSHSHWDHQEGVVQLPTSKRWGLLLVDL